MNLRRLLLTVFAAWALPTALIAQRTPPGQSPDNVVTLLSAQTAELLEIRGQSVRKVVGPARFYHNRTYLICDTAYWNVDEQVIKAIGHVKIVQDRTQLTSETLDYIIEEDMAKFRGLVQLEDKDKNVLRTRYLDYNTKDSVAVFQNGGAMKDKDGQVIESRFGSYESKLKTFTFMDNVQMYSDATFIKTSRLVYNTDTNLASFGYATDVWNDDNMMSANDGWFDRGKDEFFFRRNVHILTPDREGWSDSLLYKRPVNEVDMRGNAQVLDTTRNVHALGGRLFYQDTLSRLVMTRRPAIITVSEEKDTAYVGGDTLIHQGIPRCLIDSMEVVLADKRKKDMAMDPVMEYRRKAAEAAAKAAEEAAKDDPNRPPDLAARPAGTDKKAAAPSGKDKNPSKPKNSKKGKGGKKDKDKPQVDALAVTAPVDTTALPAIQADSLSVPSDSLTARLDSLLTPIDSLTALSDTLSVLQDTLAALADTLAAPSDTLAPQDTLPPAPKDSTKVDFVWGWGHVKLYRDDIQLASDSLAYNALDSLVRIYKEPFVFQDGDRQYTSDSIYVAIKNNALDKASLMSNAFILTQEDSLYYDQIKGAEMLAYFDSTGALRRFDALGGATALFYLEENNAIATANKVDSKMLSATFRDGAMERILYFDSAKNDAYPVVQLPPEEQRMKGFNWKPELRPRGLEDITDLKPKKTERNAYAAHVRPDYPQTEDYFAGYMNEVYRDLENRKNRPRAAEASEEDPMESEALQDTVATVKDTTARRDSLSAASDSLKAGRDSLAVKDSLSTPSVPSEEIDPKALKKAERERIKAEKKAAREARWAELDRRDAEKAEAKKQKKLEKKRQSTLKLLKREAARAAKEKALYEKYLRRYQKQQAKKAR